MPYDVYVNYAGRHWQFVGGLRTSSTAMEGPVGGINAAPGVSPRSISGNVPEMKGSVRRARDITD
jgi:hypothetical protein